MSKIQKVQSATLPFCTAEEMGVLDSMLSDHTNYMCEHSRHGVGL